MNFRSSARTILTGSLLAIALVGCGGNGTSSNAQGLTAGSTPAEATAGHGRGFRGPRDPAQMARRFDQNGDGTIQLAELPERMQERMRTADTNSDGTISTEEMNAHREAQRAAHFARMDTNNDGAVTAEEAGAERFQHLSAADADHDGRITRQELDAAHASGALRGHFGRGPGMMGGPGMMRRGPMDPAHMVQRFDQNGDGALQVAELPPHMQERLGSADTNGDGVIANEELTASMERHRAERAQRAGSVQ